MRILLSLPVALLLVSCGDKNEFAAPPAMPVGIEKPIVRQETIYFDFTGRIEALEVVEVRARVKGILETISDEFVPGRKVEKGTPLFGIEKAPYAAAYDSASAALAKAVASQELADITYKKMKDAIGSVSEIQVEQSRIELATAKALVAAAEADLAAAKVNLDYCTITAPITGRISEVMVDRFNLVGSGESTLLCTIVDDSSMHVYFEVDERRSLEFLRRRKDHQNKEHLPPKVKLTLADGKAYTRESESGESIEIEAQIELADNRLDSDTGTLLVRAIVDNPDGRLVDGLFTRVKVPRSDQDQDRVIVPSIAIQQDLAGYYVLTVSPDNTVLRQSVVPGQRVGQLRIIDSGLKGDEQVITKGLQRVREGSLVKAIPAAQYSQALKQAMSEKPGK